jgi:hypothetical protein
LLSAGVALKRFAERRDRPVADPASAPAASNLFMLNQGGMAFDNGAVVPPDLRARPGYVPRDVAGRTGSWCRRLDRVCNDSPTAGTSEHKKYIAPGPEVTLAGAFLIRHALRH